jgi:hypothetical protein
VHPSVRVLHSKMMSHMSTCFGSHLSHRHAGRSWGSHCGADVGTCLRTVLKAAKSAALISDMEREWNAGVRVGALALQNGELPGLMKVNPLPSRHHANDESLWIHMMMPVGSMRHSERPCVL